MIGHFPIPGPDELLYSICARYASRVKYPNAKSLLRELLGAATATAVVDLPNRLSHLAAVLTAGASLTADRLIDNYTLFPFFIAFTPPERVRLLRRTMQGYDGSSVHMRSGVMASRIPAPERLRFCPICKQVDEDCFGMAYWHRLHQVPGVLVCPSHNTFLENSSARRSSDRKHFQFITADAATEIVPPRSLDSSNREHQILLKVAHDAAWLLERPSLGINPGVLYNRYLRLLIDRSLATYTGSIHVEKLLNEFRGFYPNTLLTSFNCGFTGADKVKTNWLLRLVRPHKHAYHPIYHLLLIQFLGYTAEEFFKLPTELSFFGEGPWPCLNPVAKHYRKPLILECKLSSRLRHNHPIGTFSCECGFAYARSGPDSSAEDRFRIGRILSFGRVWEATLRELWKDSSLSLSEVGRRLGVDPLTVRRHAALLKLPFSRGGRKTKTLKRANQLKSGDVMASQQKRLQICRSRWLSLMERNPKITLKTMRSRLPREYAWLLQNDTDWLKVNRPAPKRYHASTSGVDWKRRDAKYAVAVKAAALRLKNAAGRPIQVTKTAIGRAVGAITMLRQKLHKMPLTAQVLASIIETREQYAVRRVWWATYHYLRDKILPRRWQLILRANVYSLRYVPEVECVIDAAIKMLELKFLQRETA